MSAYNKKTHMKRTSLYITTCLHCYITRASTITKLYIVNLSLEKVQHPILCLSVCLGPYLDIFLRTNIMLVQDVDIIVRTNITFVSFIPYEMMRNSLLRRIMKYFYGQTSRLSVLFWRLMWHGRTNSKYGMPHQFRILWNKDCWSSDYSPQHPSNTPFI